jgi:hypothetical protein
MHFYDVAERYPVAPNAAFLPPPARVDDYRQVQRRLGLERVVVVQPPPMAPTTAAPWTGWRRWAIRRARSWWSTSRVHLGPGAARAPRRSRQPPSPDPRRLAAGRPR